MATKRDIERVRLEARHAAAEDALATVKLAVRCNEDPVQALKNFESITDQTVREFIAGKIGLNPPKRESRYG